MTTDIVLIDEKTIRNKMYYIRGEYVMLDSDLSCIYGYTTKRFNEQVKNNIDKFDNDFMFRLTDDEVLELSRSKKSTTMQTKGKKGGRVYNPYVFTEQGIYMLMTVLKGELAIKQSKALIRIFKSMKDYLTNNNLLEEMLKLSLQTNENTKNIEEIKEVMAFKEDIENIMNNFIDKNKYREFLILNGEKVEGNLTYKKIFSLSKKSIYIIDDYISLKTLVLLKDYSNLSIKIFTDNINNYLHKLEYEDFINEYKLNIEFIKTNKIVHDRYIIIDYKTSNERIYHLGASIKDTGNKITTINEINDRYLYYSIIDKLLNNNKLKIK